MPEEVKLKGGSKASSSMALNQSLWTTTPVIEGPKLDFKIEDLSLYNTGGGSCSSKKGKGKAKAKSKGKQKKEVKSMEVLEPPTLLIS